MRHQLSINDHRTTHQVGDANTEPSFKIFRYDWKKHVPVPKDPRAVQVKKYSHPLSPCLTYVYFNSLSIRVDIILKLRT